VCPYDRISAPCGVSLSIVEQPPNFLSLPYRVRCSPLARWHADSTSSSLRIHASPTLRTVPSIRFSDIFRTEVDATDDVHCCNLAPVPGFLQRKRQHSCVRLCVLSSASMLVEFVFRSSYHSDEDLRFYHSPGQGYRTLDRIRRACWF
jgi:hypothetical protein